MDSKKSIGGNSKIYIKYNIIPHESNNFKPFLKFFFLEKSYFTGSANKTSPAKNRDISSTH